MFKRNLHKNHFPTMSWIFRVYFTKILRPKMASQYQLGVKSFMNVWLNFRISISCNVWVILILWTYSSPWIFLFIITCGNINTGIDHYLAYYNSKKICWIQARLQLIKYYLVNLQFHNTWREKNSLFTAYNELDY